MHGTVLLEDLRQSPSRPESAQRTAYNFNLVFLISRGRGEANGSVTYYCGLQLSLSKLSYMIG